MGKILFAFCLIFKNPTYGDEVINSSLLCESLSHAAIIGKNFVLGPAVSLYVIYLHAVNILWYVI